MAEEVDIDWSDYVNSVHDSVCAVFFHSERIYEITITHCCRDSRTAVSTFKNLFLYKIGATDEYRRGYGKWIYLQKTPDICLLNTLVMQDRLGQCATLQDRMRGFVINNIKSGFKLF